MKSSINIQTNLERVATLRCLWDKWQLFGNSDQLSISCATTTNTQSSLCCQRISIDDVHTQANSGCTQTEGLCAKIMSTIGNFRNVLCRIT